MPGIKQKGFTIIELLFVLAIIGLFVTLAYPQLQEFKKNQGVVKSEQVNIDEQ